METKEKGKEAEAAKKKPHRGPAKKKTGKTTKKKASKKLKSQTRKTRLRPNEREVIRKHITEHFGASVVDKCLVKCNNMVELEAELIRFDDLMRKQLEEAEREVEEYLKQIDKEWKSVGRPKSVFNWRECEYLCSIGCSQEEIAGFFQVHRDTLAKKIKEEFGITWSEYYEKYSQGMKVALRRRQFQAAMEGSDQMLKFLGKNVLGQKDQVDFDGQVKVNSWVDLVTSLEGEKNDEGAELE